MSRSLFSGHAINNKQSRSPRKQFVHCMYTKDVKYNYLCGMYIWCICSRGTVKTHVNAYTDVVTQSCTAYWKRCIIDEETFDFKIDASFEQAQKCHCSDLDYMKASHIAPRPSIIDLCISLYSFVHFIMILYWHNLPTSLLVYPHLIFLMT